MSDSAEPSDATLLARAREGDRDALGLLIGRHYPAALRLCRRLLGAAEAQDIAQEAALRAILGLDRLQDPQRFGAWLHAIAANLARMSLRRRRPLSLDTLEEGAALVVWPRPMPACR
jgi:RNA polymerase sigma-70 factor (ECF subfamily)